MSDNTIEALVSAVREAARALDAAAATRKAADEAVVKAEMLHRRAHETHRNAQRALIEAAEMDQPQP